VSWSLGIIALFIGASIGFSLFQKKTGWHRAAK
jgi:hypothetical protein